MISRSRDFPQKIGNGNSIGVAGYELETYTPDESVERFSVIWIEVNLWLVHSRIFLDACNAKIQLSLCTGCKFSGGQKLLIVAPVQDSSCMCAEGCQKNAWDSVTDMRMITAFFLSVHPL